MKTTTNKEKNKIKIGLEIHGYLKTKEKLFCNCKAVRHLKKQNIKPNTFICPTCTGQPGAKPMLPNQEAIKKIVQIALILNCKINSSLIWNRKHYTYPDLPKGYQNTISGAYSIPVGEQGNFQGIKITEVHLEEDPAAWNPKTGNIDYNRSGLPLVEIVTEPDFNNAEQVIEFIKKLLLSLSYIKAVDSNAGIKADINISINQKPGKNRVEVKNLSSLESIKQAINYEISRQTKEGTLRETRRFDIKKQKTILTRKKENLADYRFIPDPDLPSLNLTKSYIAKIKTNLPETPEQKLAKLIKQHKIPKKQALILQKNFDLVEFFEKIIQKIPANFALPWVTIELPRILNYNKTNLTKVNIKPEHFIELLNLIKLKKLTPLKAKETLNKFIPKSFSPTAGKIISISKLEKIIDQIISKNNQAVKDFQQGQKNALNFLIGQTMKLSQKQADYKQIRELLLKKLK